MPRQANGNRSPNLGRVGLVATRRALLLQLNNLVTNPAKVLHDVATFLREKVDKHNSAAIQARQISHKFLTEILDNTIVELGPEFVGKLRYFMEGYIREAKPDFENGKYAGRVFLAVVAALALVDILTDGWSAALLYTSQNGGEEEVGARLFAVLALHELLDQYIIYFCVYGRFHRDMVYSFFQVKGIVDAFRVIWNEPQAEGALMDPISVLFIHMVNDMCIESSAQVGVVGFGAFWGCGNVGV